MAATESTMHNLGSIASHFTLPEAQSGLRLTLDDVNGACGTLICFICNHCPFVKHINEGLVQLARDYIPLGIGIVAISSNDVVNYPEDSFENMKRQATKLEYPFPYLYDETQEVAREYRAACTPDFFLFDDEAKLVYRGQMDDSRPGNGIEVDGNDLRKAMDCLLDNSPFDWAQLPSIGCGIKWKQKKG